MAIYVECLALLTVLFNDKVGTLYTGAYCKRLLCCR